MKRKGQLVMAQSTQASLQSNNGGKIKINSYQHKIDLTNFKKFKQRMQNWVPL